jgi:hypothetical protein
MSQKCDLVHNSTNFSKLMMSKIQKAYKIYNEASSESEQKWIAHLKFYQFVVKLVIGDPEFCMGIGNNARGLLVYAAMGMGKTRAAVASALAIKDNRPVVILLPKSLQTNMEKTILEVCEMVKDKRSPDDLYNKFSFVSMDAYNCAKQLKYAGRGKKHPKTGIPQKEGLDGKLLIVDEAHNLFRSIINSGVGDGDDASNARQVYEYIMHAKDLKILFMTGTPAAKDPFEIVPCFNMLAGYSILPERYDTFCSNFIDYKTQTIINADKLANLLTGMVSHVSHELPTEPFKEGAKKGPGDDGWFPVEMPVEVVEIEMSKPQYLAYVIIREKEDREASSKKFSTNVSTAPLSLPGKNSNAISIYYVKSRTISTYYDDESGLIDELHSPKLIEAMRYVNEAKGIVLVYSQFVESGGISAFCKYLETINKYQKYELPTTGGSNSAHAIQLQKLNTLTNGHTYDKYIIADEIKNIKLIWPEIEPAEYSAIETILKSGPITINNLADISCNGQKVSSAKSAELSLSVHDVTAQLFAILIFAHYLAESKNIYKLRLCETDYKVIKFVNTVSPNLISETAENTMCICGACKDCPASYCDAVGMMRGILIKPPFAPACKVLIIRDSAGQEHNAAEFNTWSNLRRTWATADSGLDRCIDCAGEKMLFGLLSDIASFNDCNIRPVNLFDEYCNCRCGSKADLSHIHGLLCAKTKTERMKHILNFRTSNTEAIGAEFIQVNNNLHSSKYLWETDTRYVRFYTVDIASALVYDLNLIKLVLAKDKTVGKGKIGIMALYTPSGDLNIIDGLDVLARNIIDEETSVIVKIITRRELIESYVRESNACKINSVSFTVTNDKTGGNEIGKSYAIISGAITTQNRQKIQDILNSKENMYGDVIKVLAISKTGAEGLNLKNVSMVIHLEPYWDMARHDQVTSRAVRMGSHDMLPREDRVVRNVILISKENAEVRKDLGDVVKEDKTIDQRLYNTAKEKKVIIEKLRDVLKQSCIECRAFGYPGCYTCKPTDQKLYGYENDITRQNPCVADSTTEMEATEIVIDDIKYYYTLEPTIQIYKYSDKIDAFIPLSTADDEYIKVRAKIELLIS